MSGVTPFDIIIANVVINGAYGILPAIAIVVMGILILRRLPPRTRRHDELAASDSTRKRNGWRERVPER